MEYLKLLLPALITIFGNFVFYIFIKKRVDKSLERSKVVFSGVFNEKLIVYKEILNQYHHLIHKIESYNVYGNDYLVKEIKGRYNDFVHYTQANEPLISPKLRPKLEKMCAEIYEMADLSCRHYQKGAGAGSTSVSLKDQAIVKIKQGGNIDVLIKEINEIISNEMNEGQ